MSLDFRQNYFELFGLPVDFSLDRQQLATRFRELQAQFHPDKFVNASEQERRVSVQSTGFINEAQLTLESPRLRARYLLQLADIEFNDETDTTSDGAFLMQQMDYRDRLESLSSLDDAESALDKIDQFQSTINAKANQLEQAFVSAYADHDYPAAKETVLKMKYFERLKAEIKQLEERLEDSVF